MKNGLSLLKKILEALWQLPAAFHKTKHPSLFMTLLVKNEEDLLEQNLIFHKQMGVDGFIVTDNNSTDRTLAILEKYYKKGWIKEIIDEKATDYQQKKWVDRMVQKAKYTYHADWVINADADEFWYAPSGSLKTELVQTTANVLRCEMRSVYPEENKPLEEWKYTVTPVKEIEKYNLSCYSVFARQIPKVMHRTKGYIQISMGNHKVVMVPKRQAESKICIYHYNIRGRKHFLEKMINGGRQLEQNPSKHGGRHWRYFYQLYKENRLNEEYNRVIGADAFERLLQDGYIHKDITMVNWFNSNLKLNKKK